VAGTARIGGLIGMNNNSVSNSYATGPVNGLSTVGGLVGQNQGPIEESYSIGAVTGTFNLGGLVGVNSGSCNNSFWDTTTSGQGASSCGTGKATALMQTETTFTNAGWNFSSVWSIAAGHYPNLHGNKFIFMQSTTHQRCATCPNLTQDFWLKHYHILKLHNFCYYCSFTNQKSPDP